MPMNGSIVGTEPRRPGRPDGAAAEAQRDEMLRQRTAADIAEIQHDLGRTQNPNRVRAVKTFMDRRDARVYVPSSVIGSRLFTLLQDMDRIYANIERGKLRSGTAQALLEKQQLETQIMELIQTLVEITATMAVENKQTDAARDPAVTAIIKRLKEEAAAGAPAGGADAAQKAEPPSRRRPRAVETELGTPPDPAPHDAAIADATV